MKKERARRRNRFLSTNGVDARNEAPRNEQNADGEKRLASMAVIAVVRPRSSTAPVACVARPFAPAPPRSHVGAERTLAGAAA
jgi:hypothetical protein